MTKTDPNTKKNLKNQGKPSRPSPRCKKTRKSPKTHKHPKTPENSRNHIFLLLLHFLNLPPTKFLNKKPNFLEKSNLFTNMAPKRSRVSGSAPQSAPPRFLSSVTQKQHGIVGEKRLFQEIGIEIPAFDSVPRVREILTGYRWVPFNNMLGECNKTIVQEFYANAFEFGAGDYRSYVRGVYISFSPEDIDSTFGFRPEGQCGVQMRRAAWREGAITDAEYDQIREALAMPGKDWRYSRQGVGRDYRVQACCLWQSCGPNGGPTTLRHALTRRRSSFLGAWASTPS
jgi:hypothetical protein